MKLHYLQEFVYLAECLNMTETANRFFMTQPALAKHLSALEDEYHATLIERSTHGCRLTNEGEVVYTAAKEILAVYEDSLEKVRRLNYGFVGNIKIGSLLTSGMEMLSDRLMGFYKKYPDISVEFISLSVPDMIDRLKKNAIDIAFMNKYPSVPEDEYTYIFNRMVHLTAYIGKNNPLAGKGSVAISELNGSTFIYPGNIAPYMDQALMLLKNNGLGSCTLIHCESFETIPFLLTRSDTCFIAADDPGMRRLLEEYSITVDFDDCRLDIPIYLISRNDNKNPCVKNFLQFCTS